MSPTVVPAARSSIANVPTPSRPWPDLYKRLAPAILAHGYNPIPFDEVDGRKVPRGVWKPFQSRIMSGAELDDRIEKFGECPMVAIPTGRRSGLTVVDIDGGAKDIDFARETFGEPNVMVETAKFGVHLYFNYSGEKNAVGVLDRPIDIRGEGGLIIVPGSNRDGKVYRFIKGGWGHLSNLTPIRPVSIPTGTTKNPKREYEGPVLVGQRHNALFNFGRNSIWKHRLNIRNAKSEEEIEAGHRDGLKAFRSELLTWNWERCALPLPEGDINYQAEYLWGRADQETLYGDGVRRIGIPDNAQTVALAREHPGAFALNFQLRQKFGVLTPFSFPINRAHELGQSPNTFLKRIRVLEEQGLLKIKRGGMFSPTFAEQHRLNEGRGDVNRYVLLDPPPSGY